MLNPAFLASLGAQVGSNFSIAEQLRRKPHSRSANSEAVDKLDQAFVKRNPSAMDARKAGRDFTLNERASTPQSRLDQIKGAVSGADQYGSSSYDPATHTAAIKYNPNSDRAIYAHELGHIESQLTPAGLKAHQLAHAVNGVASAGSFAAPFAISLLTEGGDDAGLGTAAAVALNLPEIVKEVGADVHALGILKDAGMQANLGQRARMAGALMSYVAKPLLASGVASFGGNTAERIIDERDA